MEPESEVIATRIFRGEECSTALAMKLTLKQAKTTEA